jgi:hypothetical protein
VRVLQDLQRWYTFEMDVIDIDLDTTTRDEYGLLIPVVLIEGKEPLAAPISQGDLERGVADLPRRRGGFLNLFRRS